MNSSLLEAQNIAARWSARYRSGRLEHAALLLASTEQGKRIAAVALLRSLWHDADANGEAVEELLSAFVRARTAHRPEEERLETDVQCALSALGERPLQLQERPLDLSRARLSGVEWPFARLQGAHLMHTDLRGALLVGADLRGAWLRGAYLERANLDRANLCGADLRGAIGWKARGWEGALFDEQTLWPDVPLSPRHGR